MPIKLNWAKGINLGLSLIYLAIMGFFQVIFIIIAQYGLKIGSIYTVVLIPFGAILATFYSIIILFESSTSMKQYRAKRQNRGYNKKKKAKKEKFIKKIRKLASRPRVRPALLVILFFTIFFLLGLGFASIFVDDETTLFIIGENGGSIGSLLSATYMETKTKRRIRK